MCVLSCVRFSAPFPAPGDLPNPGIKPTSLVSPALTGGFFTTNATWEAPLHENRILKSVNICVCITDSLCCTKETKHYKSTILQSKLIRRRKETHCGAGRLTDSGWLKTLVSQTGGFSVNTGYLTARMGILSLLI